MGLLNFIKRITTPVEPDPKMELVYDCLSKLDSLKIVDGNNGYLCNLQKIISGEDGLKENLNKIQEHCEVCAKGALFISYIDKYNKIKFSDLNIYSRQDFRITNSVDDLEIINYLHPLFSEEELNSIEAAFEGPPMYEGNCEHLTDYELGNIFDYYYNYPNPKNRLRAILENIIENGTFTP